MIIGSNIGTREYNAKQPEATIANKAQSQERNHPKKMTNTFSKMEDELMCFHIEEGVADCKTTKASFNDADSNVCKEELPILIY